MHVFPLNLPAQTGSRPKPLSAMFAVAILACLASLPSSTALAQISQTDHARQPLDLKTEFELYKDRIFVDVQINGQGPFRFIVDTGASGMGRIDKAVVEKLNLKVTGSTLNSDGINTASIDVVNVESLSFGDLAHSQVSLLSRDYNGNRQGKDRMDGILGFDFFAGGTLEIDYVRKKLRFQNQGVLNPRDADVHAYEDSPELPIEIQSKKLQGWVDTGSNAGLHFPKQVLDWMKTSEPRPAGTGRRANSEFTIFVATIQEPLTIGGITVEQQMAGFSEPLDRINIGANFMKDYVLTIDQTQKLICLRKPEAPAK